MISSWEFELLGELTFKWFFGQYFKAPVKHTEEKATLPNIIKRNKTL